MLKHGGYLDPSILDFSINVNPCVDEAIIDPLLMDSHMDIHRYPQISGEGLLSLIAQMEKVPEAYVILGNGATECLYACARALKAQTVLVIDPTFSEYRRAFEVTGSQVLSLKMNVHESSTVIEQKLLQQIKKIKSDVVVLCQPNSPTGLAYSLGFIRDIAKLQSAHKGFLLVDESFRQFEGIASAFDVKQWNLLVLMSMTKYYGVAGLRIGYLKATKSLIMTMKDQQVPWSVNGLVQKIMPQLMADSELEIKTKEWYKAEKTYLSEALSKLTYMDQLPSQSNFILCQVTKGTGTQLNQWLMSQTPSIGIRTCEDYEGLTEAYVRIGLKDHESNIKLVEALMAYEAVCSNE